MGKYLDSAGISELWSQVKAQDATQIKTNVTDKLGVANGIATLGSDSKLTASQLPALKTVNGESIVGSGNIAIDLNIYQIVESLPESNQNPNKIYLVLTAPATGQEQDVYTEYLWANNKWEKLGEYKAAVDLEPYVKKDELDNLVSTAGYIKADAIDAKVKELNYVKFTDEVSDSKAGVMTSAQFNKLEAIEAQATKDEALTVEEVKALLV